MGRFAKILSISLAITSSLAFGFPSQSSKNDQKEFEHTLSGKIHTIDQDLKELREVRSKLDKAEWEQFDKTIGMLTIQRKEVDQGMQELQSLPPEKKTSFDAQLKQEVIKLDAGVYNFKQKYADKSYGMPGILGL